MPSPLPDLSAPDWTLSLVSALEQAALAISRLDTRISATSADAAWRLRACWSGYAAALRAQGVEIDEIDIFSREYDLPLPGRRPIATLYNELSGLESWRDELRQARRQHWRELIPLSLDLPGDWSDRPLLLRALELGARYARAERSSGPWLAFPALLGALGVTRNVLPCLVPADKAWRLAPRDRAAIVPRYLKSLTRLAEDALEQLSAIEASRQAAARAIAAERRPGALGTLLARLMIAPLTTPREVARTLDLTLSGAGKLLARAAALDLVVEVSARQSWRVYLARDLATRYGFVAARRGRPPAPAASTPPIDDALARFDAEMAALDAQLARLGVTAPAD
ncbi:hypothetical protein [Sphingomonas sp.]|uniref:hypothetical protein n=2 Tax=unclassified Sphingomonas TaxID=196159 RepID=UPI0025806D74|nr:hypothetical protein [Sphingomonas sp.]